MSKLHATIWRKPDNKYKYNLGKITVASLFGLRPIAVPRPELRNQSNLTNFGRRWRGEGEGSIDSCVSAVENQVFAGGVGGGRGSCTPRIHRD